MNFLPDVYVQCEVCGGRRYNHETLAVHYNGYSIADLLETPVSDVLQILENIRRSSKSCKPWSTLASDTFTLVNLRSHSPAAKRSASSSPANSASARPEKLFICWMSRPRDCPSTMCASFWTSCTG